MRVLLKVESEGLSVEDLRTRYWQVYLRLREKGIPVRSGMVMPFTLLVDSRCGKERIFKALGPLHDRVGVVEVVVPGEVAPPKSSGLREKGKRPNGMPLHQTCWNCTHLREYGVGNSVRYKCHLMDKSLRKDEVGKLVFKEKVQVCGGDEYELRTYQKVKRC